MQKILVTTAILQNNKAFGQVTPSVDGDDLIKNDKMLMAYLHAKLDAMLLQKFNSENIINLLDVRMNRMLRDKINTRAFQNLLFNAVNNEITHHWQVTDKPTEIDYMMATV